MHMDACEWWNLKETVPWDTIMSENTSKRSILERERSGAVEGVEMVKV